MLTTPRSLSADAVDAAENQTAVVTVVATGFDAGDEVNHTLTGPSESVAQVDIVAVSAGDITPAGGATYTVSINGIIYTVAEGVEISNGDSAVGIDGVCKDWCLPLTMEMARLSLPPPRQGFPRS